MQSARLATKMTQSVKGDTIMNVVSYEAAFGLPFDEVNSVFRVC
jgi:hypothetical protein